MPLPVPSMNNAIEPMIQKVKDTLTATGLFNDVNEGEKIYDGGTTAWVIPGPIRINSRATSTLQLNTTLYVIVMSSDPDTTPAALRKKMHPAYDAMLEDVTFDGTCWNSIPTLWHPGFVQMGEETYVGIMGQWLVITMQGYSPKGV